MRAPKLVHQYDTAPPPTPFARSCTPFSISESRQCVIDRDEAKKQHSALPAQIATPRHHQKPLQKLNCII